jgi:pyridoxine 5-phosphate synthase
VLEIKPAQVTLVPDPPDALTSNAGWDTIKNRDFLCDVIKTFKTNAIRTSIFTDTMPKVIEGAAHIGTDRIELYTEPYAATFNINKEDAVKPFIEAANIAAQCNLGLNAGHDLNLENLHYFVNQVPGILEVSIGHALISDALYFGLENTIQQYIRQLQ